MPRSLDEILAGIPGLAALDADQRALVAGCARNVRYDEGAYLFREGDPAATFYAVRQGSVALEAFVPPRGVIAIETIEAGELLGWSWLFPPYTWHFDGRALSVIRATAFDGACLRQKCADDPKLGYGLMSLFAQVLIDRLQSTRLRLLDVYGDVRAL